jgi:hypothetical protein
MWHYNLTRESFFWLPYVHIRKRIIIIFEDLEQKVLDFSKHFRLIDTKISIEDLTLVLTEEYGLYHSGNCLFRQEEWGFKIYMLEVKPCCFLWISILSKSIYLGKEILIIILKK